MNKCILFRLALCGVAMTALVSGAQGQAPVNVSLNLRYNDPFDPTEGGTWTLVAKTNDTDGIQMINAIMNNVNGTGITLQSGINAATLTGNPIVNGTIVELLYLQNPSVPANVVIDVGQGTGTPGNVPNDPLKNTAWNNVASIATGTFGGSRPTFTANADTPPDVTDANTFSTSTAPFTMSAAASVTTTVRGDSVTPDGLERGDANRDWTVNSDDFDLLAFNFGLTTGAAWGQGDFNDSGSVNSDDFDLLAFNFGPPNPPPPAVAAVPEPASGVVALLAAAVLAGRKGPFRRQIT